MKRRRSSGRELTICPMRPCSTIEYALVPTPVPRKSSVTVAQGGPCVLFEHVFARTVAVQAARHRDLRVVAVLSGGSVSAYSGLVLSKVRVTSAMPFGPRDSEPLKMTSSMARPRRCFALCSPKVQRMASTMFDLPHSVWDRQCRRCP